MLYNAQRGTRLRMGAHVDRCYVVIYMVILMALFNFFSHGSQDLYPSFLIKQLNYTTTEQTVTSVIYNVGGKKVSPIFKGWLY